MSSILRLLSLAYGGDALARDENGRAVFVPFGLPGELVRVEIVEQRDRFARARLLGILEPSPDRIAPRCPHSGECGGCHYQHLDYPAQLTAKRDILVEQLRRIGGFTDPPVGETVPSPDPWGYRNHARFSVDAEGRLGYQAARSNRVVPITECPILEPALAETWPLIELEPGHGLSSLTLWAGANEEALLALETENGEAPEVELDLPLSVVHLGTDGAGAVLAGSDYVVMEILGRPFRVSASSFFQANTAVAAEMVRRVLAALDLRGGETALDLYCGVGLFSAFLAPRAARLIAVESSLSACADFEINLDEFENVELYEAAVEESLPHLAAALAGRTVEAVVLDPPRAGLSPVVKDALLALAPERLVYVSCDPSTLARDLARLTTGGYILRAVTPLDLLPQTFHIESISLLTK